MSPTEKPATLEELYAVIRAQAEMIAALQQEVADLKRRLGMNSGNASTFFGTKADVNARNQRALEIASRLSSNSASTSSKETNLSIP